MKRVVWIFILLLLPFASAEVENYNNVSSLTLQVDISSHIQKTKGIAQEISAELEFYPKEYSHQTILSEKFLSDPQAETGITENGVKYTWNRDSSQYDFSVSSKIFVENNLIKIYDKISYPTAIPEEIQVYTSETEIIDITPEIDALAEELIGGEDDLYKIVFILANWTQNNIEYNLSTLNVQASQKSSWVLENREGVCDEMTNLFISLARSRGIPARFVSGMVYTNLQNDFGAHGWAEVYIDGQWMPVDVTYGTFGWIDPSHIKFKDEFGSNEASVSYEWIGNGLEINVGEVDFQTTIAHVGGAAEEYISLELEALKYSVGPGSYVPIQITVSNPNSFYVPVQLYLTKAPNVIGKNTKSVLLEPKEEKNVFWVIQVPEDVDPLYLYTTSIEVQTMFGGSAETSFDYASIYETESLEDAEEIISSLTVDEDKPYLDDVSLDCSLDKEQYYSEENAVLICSLEGELSDVDVCFEEACLAAEEKVKWTIALEDYQSQRLLVRAERNDEARYAYFDLHIIEIPNLRVEDISFKEIDFYENEEIDFTLVTDSAIKDLLLTVENVGIFSLSSLEGQRTISTKVSGKAFAEGEIIFHMTYTDALGTSYDMEQREKIIVRNVPWYYEFWLSFLSLFKK
ncbi:MAG: transglutaminase-like domain-containing protein [bacterium]|nr:transglutaminase-like domain-containing protein [bacterium]